jgi:sugar lactone lactonase YvrE
MRRVVTDITFVQARIRAVLRFSLPLPLVSFAKHAATSMFAFLFLLLATASFARAQSLQPGGPTDFGSTPVGSSAYITLSFTAGTYTTISSIDATTDGATGKDFTVAQQNCVGTLNPPQSCSIELAFVPTQAGLRRGYLAITDGTGTVVNHVYLHGIGIGAQIVFMPSTVTVHSSAAALAPTGFSAAAAVYDGAGNVYFDDIVNSRILEMSANGTYSTIATIPGNARSSIAIAGDGTLYVSSPTQAVVYAFKPGAIPAPISTGSVTLVTPTGLITDGVGYLYIADAAANHIVRVALDGSGSTTLTLTGLTAPLSSPGGLAIDAGNNIYVTDSGNDRIIKFGAYTGTASVVAVSGLTLNNPSGLAVDAAGTLYIADTGDSRVVVAPPALPAFVLATPGATLATPTVVTLSGPGNLLVADYTAGLIYFPRAALAINFPTSTKVGTLDTADGTRSFTIQNTGNLTLVLNQPASGNNPSISSKAFIAASAATCPVASPTGSSGDLPLGYTCTYAVEFSPTNTGVNNADFTIAATDAGGSGISTSPVVALSGTGFSSLASFTLVASPSMTGVGIPVGYTLTALNSQGTPATDYLATVTFTSTDSTAVFLSGSTYTFTAADAGVHVFPAAGGVAFHQLGTFTISVADNSFHATSNKVLVSNQPTIALTSSTGILLIGNPVTFTSTVSFTGGSPTGTVNFYSTVNNGTPSLIATEPLNSGVATLTTNFSTVSAPCVTAVYSGDANFATSTSTSVCETVEDYSINLALTSASSVIVNPAQPAAFSFLVSPVGGSTLAANVTFSATGLPANSTYSFSPTTLATGAPASTVLFTITPPSIQANRSAPQHALLTRLAPITLALLLLPLLRRRKLPTLLALVLLTLVSSGLTGCLSGTTGGYYATNPVAYTVTVTATSGAVSHSTTVSLTVQ